MSSTESEFEDGAPEVFDFLEELERDQGRGIEHPLSHYLIRYPGFEEAISAEFLARKAPHTSKSAPLRAAAADGEVGPYKLEKELGRGGQGVVYLAEDTRIARHVALKLLPPAALLLSADRKARLRREAEVISKLEHPGICGIYDAEISGDLAYIAMHYIEGETLGALIARCGRARAGEAEPPESEFGRALFPETEAELFCVLEFFERAARALHAAHEVGVVHRDIKPGNLMVTPSGAPVWLDFGQAREMPSDGKQPAMQLTMSGEVFGTPAYMSPEQVAGKRDALDPRTDVWALCVSLFEALTLERPFEGQTAHALLFAVQTADPRSARELNPSVTKELEVVLMTGLERDLDRRYRSAAELADELARLRAYLPIRAQPASTALKFKRWCQRHPLVFASISGVLVMLLVGLTWTLYMLELEGEALDHALGRHLAERAATLVNEDPAAALALGIEAVELAPSYQARSALYSALERCNLAGEFDGDPAMRFRDVALSPDGALLGAALSDGTGRLYDVASHQLLAQWDGHVGEATAVAFSSDGSLIATRDDSGRIALVDVSERAVRSWSEAGDGAALGIDFGVEAAVPQLIAEAPADALLFQLEGDPSFTAIKRHRQVSWELQRPGEQALLLEQGVTRDVLAAAFSPDGTRLAVAASRGGVVLFDVASGRELATFESLLKTVKLLWTPDGEFVIAQTIGAFVKVWFATPRPDVYRLFGGGGALADARFSDDGERAATLSKQGLARLWSTPSDPDSLGRVGALLMQVQYPGEQASSVALSQSGQRLVICGELGAWMVSDEAPQDGLLIEVGAAKHATFLSGGERVLVVGERAAVISATSGGAPVLRLGSQAELQVAELEPAQGLVVLATADGQLACYDSTTGAKLWSVALAASPGLRAIDLAFHPDGSEVAIACEDRTLRFRRMSDGSRSREPQGVFPPRDLDWSADAARLLVTGAVGRGALLVKELASDQRMRASAFHDGNILGGCFSPDGQLVLTYSEDGTIFVRDVQTGSPFVQLVGDGAPIQRASFSAGPGVLRVIAALQDGYARVWPVDPLPGARARKPRELYEWEVAREVRLARPLVYRR